jgi:aspartyl-tRNA(Asn)/glutamyl-tRNA(Gln) amidotransferase subunit A
MIPSLCDASAEDIARGVRSGETTAAAVLEATLARIEAADGRAPSTEAYVADPADRTAVHAFITRTVDRARHQAESTDARVARGEDPGPLAGVPLAVKDIFCVRDTFSTAGSRILANFRAPYSATPVDRLEAAGAVTVGKVNLDEFAFGSSSESSAFLPPPGNPWDP